MNTDEDKMKSLINQWQISDAAKQDLLLILSKLKLINWEENFVYALIGWGANPATAAQDWVKWIEILRGNNPQVEKFGYNELRGVPWTAEAMIDEKFRWRLARTVFWVLNINDTKFAMMIRECLEYASDGTIDFDDLPENIGLWYRRLYLIVCFYNFNFLPDHIRLFLIRSHLLLLAYQIGFDFEEFIRNFINGFINFEVRSDIVRQLRAFLLDNPTPLGKNNAQEPATINYWVEKFRLYSNKNFGGMDLINFIDDKNYTNFCSVLEKELIRLVLQLYTHLVNGFLLIPDGDVESVIKFADEIEKEDKEDNSIGIPEDVNFAEWIKKTKILDHDKKMMRGWLKKQADLLILKERIFNSIRNIDWRTDQYISNLLELSDIMNKIFGPPGILVYFDEDKNQFVLNED